MLKKYFAEVIGTFALTLAVIVAINTNQLDTTLAAGLTLGLFVYTLGSISGAHFNPAVTIGAWTLGKIRPSQAVGYIIAQFIGAGLALLLASWMVSTVSLLDLGIDVSNSWETGVGEFIGAFFFMFGVAAVIYGKVDQNLSGVVVGGSLMLGITFALTSSNGVLNPALAFGIGSFSWMYVIAPIIGSILGMQAFKFVAGEK